MYSQSLLDRGGSRIAKEVYMGFQILPPLLNHILIIETPNGSLSQKRNC